MEDEKRILDHVIKPPTETEERRRTTGIETSDLVSSPRETIVSADGQVTALLQSGQQEIARIEQQTGLSTEDIDEVREEIGLTQKLRNIAEKARVFFNTLKNKILRSLPTPENARRPLEEEKIQTYPLIEEARRRRKSLFKERGIFQMSETDFRTYFKSSDQLIIGADLEQGNMGDCYLVAAIHALSCSPHFEMIIRSSMRRLENGIWEVKIPLLTEDGETITITPEDLLPTKEEKPSEKDPYEVLEDSESDDLTLLKGKEGLQVLEAAYIKRKFKTVDKTKARGGRDDEVLEVFGGDGFRVECIEAKPEKLDLGSLATLSKRQNAILDFYLENYDPEIHIATAGTALYEHCHLHNLSLSNIRDIFKPLFVRRHAYSILGVNRRKKEVTVANPWDTGASLDITFEDFKVIFGSISIARIDSAKLLENIKQLKQKKT